MRIFKRSIMAVTAVGAAGAIATVASIPALAGTTSGVRYDQSLSRGVLGPNGTECGAIVMSAAASTGSPAYASAMVTNTLTNACTGWLQNSVNGGAWTDVSPKQSLPAGQGLNNYPWYKTANYYAGPGTRIRACIEPTSVTTPICTGPVSLPASTAAPANDATSVYYAHNGQTANISAGPGVCSAYLSSSTRAKAAASQVNMVLHGIEMTCSGWLESSADNGKTWEQATPTYSAFPNIEWAFSSAIADGTGQLVRACVQGTAAKVCTAAW